MLAMNRSAPKSNLSASRRFFLLPEESVDGPSRGPRIRRYQLTSVGRRRNVTEADSAAIVMARECSRLGRMW